MNCQKSLDDLLNLDATHVSFTEKNPSKSKQSQLKSSSLERRVIPSKAFAKDIASNQSKFYECVEDDFVTQRKNNRRAHRGSEGMLLEEPRAMHALLMKELADRANKVIAPQNSGLIVNSKDDPSKKMHVDALSSSSNECVDVHSNVQLDRKGLTPLFHPSNASSFRSKSFKLNRQTQLASCSSVDSSHSDKMHSSPDKMHSSPDKMHSSPDKMHSSPDKMHSSPDKMQTKSLDSPLSKVSSDFPIQGHHRPAPPRPTVPSKPLTASSGVRNSSFISMDEDGQILEEKSFHRRGINIPPISTTSSPLSSVSSSAFDMPEVFEGGDGLPLPTPPTPDLLESIMNLEAKNAAKGSDQGKVLSLTCVRVCLLFR